MIFASSRKAIRVSVRQTHGYFIYCQLVFHLHPKLESRRKIFQRIQSNSFLIVYQNKSNGFHLFVRTHTWKTVVKASFKQFFYRPSHAIRKMCLLIPPTPPTPPPLYYYQCARAILHLSFWKGLRKCVKNLMAKHTLFAYKEER